MQESGASGRDGDEVHRRLTILLVLSRLERRWEGGIGRVTSAMASALAARGHAVHMAGRADDPNAIQRPSGVTLHPWPAAGPKLRQIPVLLDTLARLRPDVVHFHAALPHGEVVAAALARRAWRRLPLIALTPHTGTRWDRVGRRARFALGRADLVVAPSEWSRERTVANGVRPGRVRVVWNGIRLPEPLDPVAREPIVLGLGRLVVSKGLDLLVEAFAEVSHEYPAWSLVVGGAGPQLSELRRGVLESGVPADLPGHLGEVPKQDLLARASIGVVPSRADMIPGVLLEMQAHGLAVIATRVGGMAEAASGGRAAQLVAPESARALAVALRALMASESTRQQLGREARAVSAARTWPILAKQLERHYIEALHQRGAD